jgi:hypothetical protein
MEETNGQGAISTGDRNTDEESEGSVEAEDFVPKTPKDFIRLAAHKMVKRLKALEAVQARPKLIPEINRLLDLDILYALAVAEQKSGYTKKMTKSTKEFLSGFGLQEKDIPTEDLVKIQTAVQLIYQIFKDKVFKDENEKRKFKELKAGVREQLEQVEQDEEEEEPKTKKRKV